VIKELFRSFIFWATKKCCCSSSFKKNKILDKYIPSEDRELEAERLSGKTIGIIAGNGNFPILFAQEAKQHNCKVVAVCFIGETSKEIEEIVDSVTWIKLGEFGKLISFFKDQAASHVAMAGGINRVKWFGGVKLDARGAAFLLKIRSAKDDVIMRGLADELLTERIEVIDCTIFLQRCLVEEGVITNRVPTREELEDVRVGILAIQAMSAQDIGQVVIVREGVIVAVEAVEGTDRCILRGGELGGEGAVVVKFAKSTQDMRFDVPTIGIKTIESMVQAKAKTLAIEVGKCLLLDRQEVLALANQNKIAIIGMRLPT
jgi:UDP-2,3-diacylglucosamine hydrolase